ncbi:hypothetical protein BDV96DRAFT_271110 [Lophiotrema nucula]|uniref:Uncharacterized protein n=1 Tax=Lophiotrema nucula TaxID=690887 RepID=A0A6A5ZML6_9PLEO|nr:hypothetical protein BDV96DRAFT_271110 [Lophiotrema nucula]
MRPTFRFFPCRSAQTTTTTTTTSPSITHESRASSSTTACRLACVVKKIPKVLSKRVPQRISSHIDNCGTKLDKMCENCRKDELARETSATGRMLRATSDPSSLTNSSQTSPAISVDYRNKRGHVQSNGARSVPQEIVDHKHEHGSVPEVRQRRKKPNTRRGYPSREPTPAAREVALGTKVLTPRSSMDITVAP